MCLMDGLIIQAVLAEFEDERGRRSIWDEHAKKIARGRAAWGRRSWADRTVQVAEHLLRRFLSELGRGSGHGHFADRSRRR